MSDTGILSGLDSQVIERVFDTEYLPVTRANINHLAVLVQQGEMTEKELRAALEFERQQVQDLAKVAEYYRALVQEARDERKAKKQRAEQAEAFARRLSAAEGIISKNALRS